MRILDPQYNEATGGDTSPPVVNITSPAADGGWIGATSLAIAGNASEDSSAITNVDWSLNNSTWNACALSGSFPAYTWTATVTGMVQGLNTIYVRATNSAALTTTVTRTVNVDLTSPTVTFTSPVGNGGTYSTSSSTVNIAGTAADAESGIAAVAYSLNSAAYVACSGLASWSANSLALNLGSNTIIVRGTNGVGTITYATIYVTRTATIPTGVIVMFNGAVPSGWAANTPSILDRFPVGAGSSYGVGSTGGSATFSIAAHTHPPGAHSHPASGQTFYGSVNYSFYSTQIGGTALSSAYHTHSGSNVTLGTTMSGPNSYSANAFTLENRPPYYGLYFAAKT